MSCLGNFWAYPSELCVYNFFLESMSALMRMTKDGTLVEAYAETLRPLVIGIAISAVIGIILGLWVGLSQIFD